MKKPNTYLLLCIIGYSIMLCTFASMRFVSHDESSYLVEARTIADCIRSGQWIGNAPVGSHGFLLKTVTALVFLVTGNSILSATLVIAVISIIAFYVCYRLLYFLLNDEAYSLAGTCLVFCNPVTLFCATKYLVDIPGMLISTLIIFAVLKKKPVVTLSLLLLLALDVREYVNLVMMPCVILYIFLNEIWQLPPGSCTLYQEMLQYMKVALRFIGKTLIIVIPTLIYVWLMVSTNFVPLNKFLFEIIGASGGGVMNQIEQLSPSFSTKTKINQVKVPALQEITTKVTRPASQRSVRSAHPIAKVLMNDYAETQPGVKREYNDDKTVSVPVVATGSGEQTPAVTAATDERAPLVSPAVDEWTPAVTSAIPEQTSVPVTVVQPPVVKLATIQPAVTIMQTSITSAIVEHPPAITLKAQLPVTVEPPVTEGRTPKARPATDEQTPAITTTNAVIENTYIGAPAAAKQAKQAPGMTASKSTSMPNANHTPQRPESIATDDSKKQFKVNTTKVVAHQEMTEIARISVGGNAPVVSFGSPTRAFSVALFSLPICLSALINMSWATLLPHDTLAGMIVDTNNNCVSVINIVINMLNGFFLYVVKFVHPETFNWNKLPHVVFIPALFMTVVVGIRAVKKRDAGVCFIASIFLLYFVIHIVKWSVIRYAVPFFPIIAYAFVLFLSDKTISRKVQIAAIVTMTVCWSASLFLDSVTIMQKLCMNALVTGLIVGIVCVKSSSFIDHALVIVTLSVISLMELMTALFLQLPRNDTDSVAGIANYIWFGNKRECHQVVNLLDSHKIVWINNFTRGYLPMFYRGDRVCNERSLSKWVKRSPSTAIINTFQFDAISIRMFERSIKQLGIDQAALVVSDLPRVRFQNDNMLDDFLIAPFLKLTKQMSMKNKQVYVFDVLPQLSLVSESPSAETILHANGHHDMKIKIPDTGNTFTAAVYQIVQVAVKTIQVGATTNAIDYMVDTLNSPQWLDQDTEPYLFNGRDDIIDCNIPHDSYALLAATFMPASASQRGIICGHFAGMSGADYWNTYGKGFQYENGKLLAMGDTETLRRKLATPSPRGQWTCVMAMFNTNGVLLCNGKQVDKGDINGSYKFDFSIGAARKHRDSLQYRINEYNFYGWISNVTIYFTHTNNYDTYVSNYFNSIYSTATHLPLCEQSTNKIVLTYKTPRQLNSCSITPVVRRVAEQYRDGTNILLAPISEQALKRPGRYYWRARLCNERGTWSQPSEANCFIVE